VRPYEEAGGVYFAGFGGFSAEETPKTSKIKTTAMNRSKRVAVP